MNNSEKNLELKTLFAKIKENIDKLNQENDIMVSIELYKQTKDLIQKADTILEVAKKAIENEQ